MVDWSWAGPQVPPVDGHSWVSPGKKASQRGPLLGNLHSCRPCGCDPTYPIDNPRGCSLSWQGQVQC